jgi:hypothetical protein
MAENSERKNIWPEYASKLAGGWKCISLQMYDSSTSNKKIVETPPGDFPLGRVLLSPNGYLSAHIAREERMKPLPSGKQWRTGEDAEVAYVARGLSMYCGYLKLYEDDEGLYWQTKVEVCSDPWRFGGIEERRVRYWEESGKRFVELRPTRDLLLEDGTRTRSILTWEKFE